MHATAIAMEWIPGRNLEQLDADAEPPTSSTALSRLSLHQRAKIAIQIVRAVQYVRTKLELAHRDLHPGNVMITSAEIFHDELSKDKSISDSFKKQLPETEMDCLVHVLGHQNGNKYKETAKPTDDVSEFRVVLIDFDLSRPLTSIGSKETLAGARSWSGGVPGEDLLRRRGRGRTFTGVLDEVR